MLNAHVDSESLKVSFVLFLQAIQVAWVSSIVIDQSKETNDG